MQPTASFGRNRFANEIAIEQHQTLRNRAIEGRRFFSIISPKRHNELLHPFVPFLLLLL